MRELPTARLLVHPRGLRHLLDPSALQQGRARHLWRPRRWRATTARCCRCDPARAVASDDGMAVRLGTRRLELAAHAGPCPAPPLPVGRGLRRLVRRRHLRRQLPRVRHRARRLDAGRSPRRCSSTRRRCARRSAAAGAAAALHAPDALRPRRRRGAPGRRAAGRHRPAGVAGAVGPPAAPTRELRCARRCWPATSATPARTAARCMPTPWPSLLAMDATLNAQGLGIWLDRQGR